MWTPVIDKTKSKGESERLEQAEKDILAQKKAITELEKRIEKLEKGNTNGK